eukprot:756977-Hanusia_phi.AAC.3
MIVVAQESKPKKRKELSIVTDMPEDVNEVLLRKREQLERRFPSTRADVGSPRTYQQLDDHLARALDALSDELLSSNHEGSEGDQVEGEGDQVEDPQQEADNQKLSVEEKDVQLEGQEEQAVAKKSVVKKKKKAVAKTSQKDEDTGPKTKKKTQKKVLEQPGEVRAVDLPPSKSAIETPKAKPKKLKKKRIAPEDVQSQEPVSVHKQEAQGVAANEVTQEHKQTSTSRATEPVDVTKAVEQESAREEEEKEMPDQGITRTPSLGESETSRQNSGGMMDKRRSLLSGLHVGATKKLQEKNQPLILVRYSEKKARQQGRFCCIS